MALALSYPLFQKFSIKLIKTPKERNKKMGYACKLNNSNNLPTINDLLIKSNYANGTLQISITIDHDIYKVWYLLYHGSYVNSGGYLGIYKNISTVTSPIWKVIQTPGASYNPRQSGNTTIIGVNDTGRYTSGLFALYSIR